MRVGHDGDEGGGLPPTEMECEMGSDERDSSWREEGR
jgi:hypothetical protein